MPQSQFVSIIIPCKEINDYANECIKYCRRLDYGNYEIILIPDSAFEKIEGTRIVPTGPVTPGAKRNIGVASSNGEVCAFIDSDAYPREDWLSNAVKYLNDEVVAVGGPGITPPEDSLMQKASGLVLSSVMVGGLSRRYKSKSSFYSDDIHSCNFITNKNMIKEAGGWNEKYWPGEDTLLCLGIERKGKKMIESSDVIVFHHRKPLFIPHLRQMFNFGLHRGFFAKKFKGNSAKPQYFFPFLLVILLPIGGLISLVNSLATVFFLGFLAAYFLVVLVADIMETRDLRLLPLVFSGIILTHLAYGIAFSAGLLKKSLKK